MRDRSLRELFDRSDAIGDRYLAEEEIEQRNAELLQARTDFWLAMTDEDLVNSDDEEYMPTKQSSISYHASSHALDGLIESRGDRLEELTGIEKLQLISFLAFWQAQDTESVEADGDPFTLAQSLDDFSLEVTPDVLECLGHLKDCSCDDVLSLIIAIAQQLKEGDYLQ